MKYSDNEMCTILLSSYIGMKEDSDVRPLTLGEWHQFIEVLIANNLEPRIVFSDEIMLLKDLCYDALFIERVKRLVERGASVAFELDEYAKRGIDVTTFMSKDYPVLLRRELKNKKPPVLFYSGDISLANKMGIGVVGSRKITDEGMKFTKRLVEKAVNEKLITYSGGAQGVDITSQTVALNYGGAVVAYIADALIEKIKKKDIVKNVSEGKLLLLSDLKPDVSFSAGRAMNRNKYIYASAMGTFVVESDYNKGGTWAGATEAIKNNWGKVLVWDNPNDGNQKLIEAGATAYEITDETLIEVLSKQPENSEQGEYTQMTLMDMIKN